MQYISGVRELNTDNIGTDPIDNSTQSGIKKPDTYVIGNAAKSSIRMNRNTTILNETLSGMDGSHEKGIKS